ncbi:MAG: hypothetical protein LBS73_05000 [Campylobacteraceae bacterium]|jgi:hypothetical protein|nr:hypothetical protein [Campylobacteraceae bacterium]
MRKLLKLIFLALVLTLLIGCGSSGGGSNTIKDGSGSLSDSDNKSDVNGPDTNNSGGYDEDGLVPLSVKVDDFPAFKLVAVDGTGKAFLRYPVASNVSSYFVDTLSDNYYEEVGEGLYALETNKALGYTALYNKQHFILEAVISDLSSDEIDISTSLFPQYFPTLSEPIVGTVLFKHFGNSSLPVNFSNYGNSLAGSPYNFTYNNASSCWVKHKDNLIYEWCFQNKDGYLSAKWMIVHNNYYQIFKYAQNWQYYDHNNENMIDDDEVLIGDPIIEPDPGDPIIGDDNSSVGTSLPSLPDDYVDFGCWLPRLPNDIIDNSGGVVLPPLIVGN